VALCFAATRIANNKAHGTQTMTNAHGIKLLLYLRITAMRLAGAVEIVATSLVYAIFMCAAAVVVLLLFIPLSLLAGQGGDPGELIANANKYRDKEITSYLIPNGWRLFIDDRLVISRSLRIKAAKQVIKRHGQRIS
jgi:hypothetical protein